MKYSRETGYSNVLHEARTGRRAIYIKPAEFNVDAFDRIVDPFLKHKANTRYRPMIGTKNVLEKACVVKVLTQNIEV